jgi:hypothetical protein
MGDDAHMHGLAVGTKGTTSEYGFIILVQLSELCGFQTTLYTVIATWGDKAKVILN